MTDLRITSHTGTPAGPTVRAAAGARAEAGGFGVALGRAVAEVDGLQHEARAVAAAVAAGERVDMARALVTIEKANIAFQFAVQVRNKLLEAYQEIMRLQV